MASGIVESTESGSSREKETKGVAGDLPRRRLVQRLLASSADLPTFIRNLLEQQGMMVAGTEAVAFLVEKAGEADINLRVAGHVRPDESTPEIRQRALEEFAKIVRPCVLQAKDGVVEIDGARQDTIDPQFCLITLLRAEGQVIGVSAVITRCPNMQRAQQRLSQMELVAGYFEMFGLRRSVDSARNVANTNQAVLQLATTVATAEGFDSAAMNLCNELATRTGATRVAIGWVVGHKIKLKAMSHTEQFDKKQELAVLIIAAMEECVDQEELVQYDPHPAAPVEGAPGEPNQTQPASSDNVTRAAAELSRRQGGVSVLSLPLRRAGDIVGVICLEFNPQKRIGANAATSLAVATELLSPQLYDRYQNDRWWITKTGISIRETSKLAIGKTHMLPKLITLLVIGLLAFICIYSPMYHVVSPFSFAATEKRIISAPSDGYIGEVVKVRPGDMVKQGDVLVEMDTSQLRLQLSESLFDADAKRLEANRLAADPTKTAESLQKRREMDAANAQADLYKYQIEQSVVKAPMAGVVLSGDWMDKKRTPVKKGDELFRIAQPGSMRLEMNVKENDIQDVKEGAAGKLATSSQPDMKSAFTVERIIPLPTTDQGSNVFKVYAIPEKLDPTWRDGMQGEARVDVKHRPLIWTWTHRFVEWVRIKTWI